MLETLKQKKKKEESNVHGLLALEAHAC